MRVSIILFAILAFVAMTFASEAVVDQLMIDANAEMSMRAFFERKAAHEAESKLLSAQSGFGMSGVYGVDYSTALSTSTLTCIKGKLSKTAFAIPRGYRSSGTLDPNVITNVNNARSAGFQYVDTYLFPCPKCGTSGASQVSALAAKIKANGSKASMIWLDVEGTQYWNGVAFNQNFFNSMLAGCASNRVSCGVYSSKSQWTAIMGGFTGGSKYPLWYAHYDKLPNFSDFVAFGGWSKPNIKQYIGDTTLCSAGIDLNVY